MTELEIVLSIAFLLALALASVLGAYASRAAYQSGLDRAYISLLDSIISLQNAERNEGLFPTLGPTDKERR